MKMAVRGELWKKWLQCLSMTVLKQNGSGLATNQYEVVLTVGNVPKHTVVHFPTTYATS